MKSAALQTPKRLSIAEILSATPPTFIRPKQIRVCRSIVGRTGMDGLPKNGGVWHPDTPEFRGDLQIVVESGNEAYGPGTHWIEERDD